MDDLTPENVAFLVKIGQITQLAPKVAPAPTPAATTSNSEA